MTKSSDALGPKGLLHQSIAGFTPRANQLAMAEAVESALAAPTTFIAESGTGTGKTFAYLVPALLSGKKVLISTGTKNLQDQLYSRDLPQLRALIPVPLTTAVLKGRANYLCRYRFQRMSEGHVGSSHLYDSVYPMLSQWSGKTHSGDISEFVDIPENHEIWPQVTSTSDNCLGSQCRDYDKCFVNKARQAALNADILVINHHLFFADLALKVDGFGQLLPVFDAVIFDEAHQLFDTASRFFGISMSGRQIKRLCREVTIEEHRERSGIKTLIETASALEKTLADVRLAMAHQPMRGPWPISSPDADIDEAISALNELILNLTQLLERASVKGEGLQQCYRRVSELSEQIQLFGDSPPEGYVAWYEIATHDFTWHLTPLDVANSFQQTMDQEEKSWVFTSATLAIGEDFSFFRNRLGITHAETHRWQSPFDFAHQALLYVPQGLPMPGDTLYTEHVVDAVLPVLKASGGRAFFLFTSHQALRRAEQRLSQIADFNLFVQGDMPRSALLAAFRNSRNGVLLGTASFWEGVDVKGESLSCVIIDKLPFASPDDPVLRARAQALTEAGANPFIDYQLPQAVLALKQGAGRLIRDENDSGVLVLCDPRLFTKAYGRTFLRSLPEFPLTRDIEDVESFFYERSIEQQVTEKTPA